MSVETRIKISEYENGQGLPDAARDFIRRDWTAVHKADVVLSSGVTTELETNISSYEYVYVNVTGDAATITLYFNAYPEIFGVPFDDTFLVFGLSDITKIRLSASADTTVRVFLAGS